MREHLMPVRVWDLPTRLFHWAMGSCVVGAIVSANIGGDWMTWHFRLGYAVFTLLAFRLFWGLIGGHWSRFANFIYSPAAVLRYLQGDSEPHEHHEVGHNPIGAFSVFALLGTLAVQVTTGLISDDQIANAGPLVSFVSGAASRLATTWHKTWGQWIMLTLIGMHITAITFYLVHRRRDMLRPMVIGDKHLPPGVPASADHWRARGLALLVISLCAAAVAWVVSLGG